MKINNRRAFLRKIGIGSLTAVNIPALSSTGSLLKYSNQSDSLNFQLERKEREFNGVYINEYLNKVAFPIGGMGAGMFCLEGTGSISHMSIRHKPEMHHAPNMFAAISVKGWEEGAKVLEGQVPDWKIFGPRDTGNGAPGANFGLPRFNHVEFKTSFPFASINLKDDNLPLEIELIGWSPFIPTDEDNSSLPVGALEYRFKNTDNKAIEAVFSYNSVNFVLQNRQKGSIKSIPNGFVLTQEGTEKEPHLETNFAIWTDEPKTVVDHCWFRGGWFDPLIMMWNTIKEGKVKANKPVEEGSPGASLFVPFKLKPGERKIIRVLMAWYVPESDLHFGDIVKDEDCIVAADCCSSPIAFGLVQGEENNKYDTYKPWYSDKFKTIEQVISYWQNKYKDLRRNSNLFKDAFYSNTLPPEITEAIAANLTILKSPTVMRQIDGRLWNWEGCSDDTGCCGGSCTHVWNYAQAIPHLFPTMERSLRHAEFCEDQNVKGHQKFRTNLPISPTSHDFHAAADGQLGGIMKVYREWRISGENGWMKKMYPLVQKSMDYCINTWDPQSKGVLEEPHHNTYDIEFWGPNGMCTSFYLGALNAISKMGVFLNEDVSRYKNLLVRGKKYMEEQLYDGEYFIQNIQWTGLKAISPIKVQSFRTQYSEEALRILRKEGPKYQYGKGCLSDGIIGGWVARMCGLEDPVDTQKIRSHLLAVHKYNLKQDMTNHTNPQRSTYALGKEGGLLLCSWPKGGKLSLPFIYSNEVWTGIEYQVASHLMLMGQVEEGLEIVRICRNRYDGRIRNPFNEYECGSWYARAMASYGMLQGLTGVRYDAVDKIMYIDSKVGDFKSFISTATGFGTIGLKNGEATLNVLYGNIDVKRFDIFS